MLFNTPVFLVFMMAVFPLYWGLSRHLRLQNAFLLAVS